MRTHGSLPLAIAACLLLIDSGTGQATTSGCPTLRKQPPFVDLRPLYPDLPYGQVERIARAGSEEAILHLAWRHLVGFNDSRRDHEKAAFWLKKGAEQGSDRARYSLAYLYLGADGVELDERQAFGLFMKAARQGLASAQFRLGGLLYLGRTGTIDEATGLVWLGAAAEKDHLQAQFILGLALLQTSSPQDRIDAYAWLRIAAEQSHDDATAEFDRLRAKLEPAELQKGEQRYQSLINGLNQRRSAAPKRE